VDGGVVSGEAVSDAAGLLEGDTVTSGVESAGNMWPVPCPERGVGVGSRSTIVELFLASGGGLRLEPCRKRDSER
jgi:hypothetical protein